MENTDNGLTRAFVCIEVPDEVVKEIARLQEVLGNWKFQGKVTELENLHLTLKFLGELDDAKLKEVKEKLSRVKFGTFEAKLGDTGTFSKYGSPKIVWVKIGGQGTFDLQSSVDLALEGLFNKEARFMSHLTLARVKYVNNKKGFVKHVSGIGVKDIKWKVDKFYLKKSELRPTGPIYTVIGEYSSLDKTENK